MAHYKLSAAAQTDIIDVLTWTQQNFGTLARTRYETLIVTALRDIAAQPDRIGSIERPELGDGIHSWHLWLSRDHARTESGVVRRPRHFLIYRIEGNLVVVGRVLHESMELERHLGKKDAWEFPPHLNFIGND